MWISDGRLYLITSDETTTHYLIVWNNPSEVISYLFTRIYNLDVLGATLNKL